MRNDPRCGIYRIINTVTGLSYIGSAKNFERRYRSHLSDLRLNRHHSSKLQNSWNKYGEANFEFVVIECCAECDLLVREQHWIDAFDACARGYNSRPRAESRLGAVASEELRAKLSQAHRGKALSEGHRAALADALRRSDVRAKISNSLRGRPLSEETRRKMAAARIGNKNALGAKRPADVVAKHTERMRGKRYGLGFKHTPEMLAKRAARCGVPWSPSRLAAYERSLRARS